MTRYAKIQKLLDEILRLKELEDLAHVKRVGKHGCFCRRCQAHRKLLTRLKA